LHTCGPCYYTVHINRPAVTSYVSTLGFGEFVTFCCRADDIRPYGIDAAYGSRHVLGRETRPLRWGLVLRMEVGEIAAAWGFVMTAFIEGAVGGRAMHAPTAGSIPGAIRMRNEYRHPSCEIGCRPCRPIPGAIMIRNESHRTGHKLVAGPAGPMWASTPTKR